MSKTRTLWIQNAVLGAVLLGLGAIYVSLPDRQAHAAGGGWETNGIMATVMSGNERLLVIDTRPEKMSMTLYRALGAGQLRLISARSYKYDIEVKDSSNTVIEKGNGLTFTEMKRLYEAMPKE